MNIPPTQNAVWIDNPGPNGTVQIRTIPTPQPGDGEVLIKIEYSGICGSDLRNLHGLGRYTPIPGHEAVGTIIHLGPNISSSSDLLLNRRVGVKWVWDTCGSCSLCLRGLTNHCPHQLNTGRSVHGTLQEYVLAKPAFVSFVSDALEARLAAPLMCAGHTLVGAVEKMDSFFAAEGSFGSAGAGAGGKTVVVLGAGGGLGHLGVQLLRQRKYYHVVAIDTGAAKEALCLELGADHYIDYLATNPDAPSRVKNITTDGEGAHAAIIISGAEDAFSLAPRLVRNGGVLVVVGLPRNDFCMPVAPIEISSRGLTIVGASAGTEAQMDELLQMAERGQVVPTVEVVELEDVAEAFQRLSDGDVVGRLVVRVS
ncbi:alcohol dehydrogenase [Talaromyces islandicus]|uniref:Alcohol dehydrogenase n=1 Tax=Talaromyces islandicus TaxID=28573 RepID=A0A0U1M2Y8_TALIS|nr:alcohol dehydrogenase [Talaromyces islandicus]